MATVTYNKQGQIAPPIKRPTIASTSGASLVDTKQGQSRSVRPISQTSITSYFRASERKPSSATERKGATGSHAPKRITAPKGSQKPQMVYSKPFKDNGKDWTREKTYQTRSKQFLNANLEFYQNQLQSKPAGHTIEEMLKWEKNYDRLEKNHRYIQWLFPLPGSRGMNPESQPLQEHEAEKIRSTTVLRKRVLKAYKMMLDFYGMELVSKETGEVTRSKNWKPRYIHLNRILKSLGCLGYEHLQYPWLRFILEEAVINKTLSNLDCGAVFHWIKALTSEKKQKDMWKFYKSEKHGKVPFDIDEEMGSEWSEEMDQDDGD